MKARTTMLMQLLEFLNILGLGLLRAIDSFWAAVGFVPRTGLLTPDRPALAVGAEAESIVHRPKREQSPLSLSTQS